MPLGRPLNARKKKNLFDAIPVAKESKMPPPRLEIEFAKPGFILNVCDYSSPHTEKQVAMTSDDVLSSVKKFLDTYGKSDDSEDKEA